MIFLKKIWVKVRYKYRLVFIFCIYTLNQNNKLSKPYLGFLKKLSEEPISKGDLKSR